MMPAPDTIVKYLRILVNTLSFRSDYASFAGGQKKILIVEGKTDEKFLESMLAPDVRCEIASNVLNSNISMSMGYSSAQPKFNCKDAIVQVIVGLSNFPPDFLPNCPKEVQNWDLYGMVDSDYQDPRMFPRTTKLFLTDTSDLETLLLSADNGLLKRIEKLQLAPEIITQSYVGAYYYAKVREALINNIKPSEIPVADILNSSMDISFGQFISESGINVHELIKYMVSSGKLKLSKERIKKLCVNTVKNDSFLKKHTDRDTFECSWENGKPSTAHFSDFWNVVNGHVILNMLKYISRNVALAYSNVTGNGLNRQFEMDLIDCYDYNSFYETRLYTGMSKAGLLQPVR